jgi:hypothetical protein
VELEKQSAQSVMRDRVTSVLSHLGRILTELRQHLELGTVATIIVRAATLNTLHSRTDSYCAAGSGGLDGGTRAVFGAGGAKAKIF